MLCFLTLPMTRTWTTRLAIAALLGTLGCAGDDAQVTTFATGSIGSSVGTSDGSSSTAATADTSTSVDASSSSSGNVDSSGTSTGETDSTTGTPMEPGHSAGQLVGAGQRMSTSSFSLELTLGQPSQLQSRHSSASYRMQGGLVGANGTQP